MHLTFPSLSKILTSFKIFSLLFSFSNPRYGILLLTARYHNSTVGVRYWISSKILFQQKTIDVAVNYNTLFSQEVRKSVFKNSITQLETLLLHCIYKQSQHFCRYNSVSKFRIFDINIIRAISYNICYLLLLVYPK